VLEGANDDSNLGGEVIDDGVVFDEEDDGDWIPPLHKVFIG
jgi:hypothetical protein